MKTRTEVRNYDVPIARVLKRVDGNSSYFLCLIIRKKNCGDYFIIFSSLRDMQGYVPGPRSTGPGNNNCQNCIQHANYCLSSDLCDHFALRLGVRFIVDIVESKIALNLIARLIFNNSYICLKP